MKFVYNLSKLSADGFKQSANNPLEIDPNNITHVQLRFDNYLSPNIIQGELVGEYGLNSSFEFEIDEARDDYKLYFSRDGVNYIEDKTFGGNTGVTLGSTGSSTTPQTQFTFMGDQALWFIAEDAIEVTTPVEQKNTGTAEYQFISEDGLTSNPATFPLEMAEGDRLRMTVTDFSNYFNIIVKYTLACILLMLMIGTGYAQNNNISSKKITTDSLRGLNGDVISLKSVLATQKNIIPNVDGTIDLGEEGFRFGETYSDTVITNLLLPFSDLSGDIGKSNRQINNIYSENNFMRFITSPTGLDLILSGSESVGIGSNVSIIISAPTSIQLNSSDVSIDRRLIVDTVKFDLLSSNTGLSSIYTRQTGGKELRIENLSTHDSARVQINGDADGGIILNGFGNTTFGSSGSPMRNDFILVKLGQGVDDNVIYSLGFMTQATNDAPNSGIGITTPQSSDSMIFSGFSTTGKYNFIGNFYTDNLNSRGYVNTDTVKNISGSLTLDDTVTVRGRLNVTQELRVTNDTYSGMGRYFIATFNANGTQGVAFNSTADNVGRFRNAGITTDARIIMGNLDLSNLSVYASNAAALSGGLTANMIYKTSTGEIRIVY